MITIIGLLLVVLTLIEPAAAQHPLERQQTRMLRIGWLAVRPASAAFAIKSFHREFGKLGYIEGKNIRFEYRDAEGNLDRLPALANDLVRLNVNVIVGPNTPAALAAKNATKSIPIVFIDVTDPVAAGLVDSLPRPGGNITGFTTISSVLAGKRLELLKETIPTLARVGILWNPQHESSVQNWKESQLPARELGLELHSMQVSAVEDYEESVSRSVESSLWCSRLVCESIGSVEPSAPGGAVAQVSSPNDLCEARRCRKWRPHVVRGQTRRSFCTGSSARR